MKIIEVINRLIQFHPPMDESHTTDVIKYGDPQQECTGIIVTCFPSADVIREAVKRGANLIIAHEPLFWSHEDTMDWLENSEVFLEKKCLLDAGNIVVWRYHDHMHGGHPDPSNPNTDYIFTGIMKELGWEDYLIGDINKPLLFQIPETDATELGLQLKDKLGLNGIRILGDPHAKVSKVFLCEHIMPMDRGGMQKKNILKIENEHIDAIIPLEMIDWTISAFVRDAAQLGHPKIMYNIGHFNFEELGMKHVEKYLPDVIDHAVPVAYVPSGDAYSFII